MKGIEVTREELYELVWAKPLMHLALDFGISDRGLGKICARLEIPVPGRGYWRQVARNFAVKRKALPKPSAGCPPNIKIRSNEDSQTSNINSCDIVQSIIEQEADPSNIIQVPNKIARFHPLVKSTLEGLLKAKPDRYARCYAGGDCLDIVCSKETARRAARIFHTLIQSLEERGHSITIHRYSFNSSWNPNPMGTFIECFGEEVRIFMMEQSNKIPGKKAHWWEDEKAYASNGQLVLKIESLPYNAGRMKQTWVDTKKKPLELQLNSFMIGLAKASLYIRLRREEREREEQERERQRQYQEMLRQKKLEEKQRRTHLANLYLKWMHAKTLREFLTLVECSSANLCPEGMTKKEWLQWAKTYVDQLDPLAPQGDPYPAERDLLELLNGYV